MNFKVGDILVRRDGIPATYIVTNVQGRIVNISFFQGREIGPYDISTLEKQLRHRTKLDTALK